jgi:hypothetical protein
MSAFLLALFRLIWLVCSCHQAVILENLALRQQLAVYKRKQKRPGLMQRDRWFWMGLARLWKGWRGALFIVHPSVIKDVCFNDCESPSVGAVRQSAGEPSMRRRL